MLRPPPPPSHTLAFGFSVARSGSPLTSASRFTAASRRLIRDGDENDQWKNRERNLDPNEMHPSLYLRSLHWCMGVMSGYSDGTIPITNVQFLFTMAVLNIGLFTFAYTVGVIGALGDSNSQASRRFQISVSVMVNTAAPRATFEGMAASSCLPPLSAASYCRLLKVAS